MSTKKREKTTARKSGTTLRMDSSKTRIRGNTSFFRPTSDGQTGFDLGALITPQSVVKLTATDKQGALAEMCERAAASVPGVIANDLLASVLDRESKVNTRVGRNWATPHARLAAMPSPLMLIIGRSSEGIVWSAGEEARVNLIAMLVAREDGTDLYLHALSALVNALRDDQRLTRAVRAGNERSLRAALVGETHGRRTISLALPLITRRLIRHMLRFADDVEVGSVFLNIDAFEDPDVLASVVDRRTFLVTGRREAPPALAQRSAGIIRLPIATHDSSSLLHLAVVLALGRRLVRHGERVLALAGPDQSNTLDVMHLFDTGNFAVLDLDRPGAELVSVGVLERVIEVASSIGRQGREGKHVGTTFIVGDEEKVASMSRQLVINPFRGYETIELNILDVTLEETIKEFSGIDGAFVIAGNGRMLAAGAYLMPPAEATVELPSGYGTRHRAAAAMTRASHCVAVVVSESAGTVSVFYQGELLLALEAVPGGRAPRPA